jgi:hypothetical protein
MKRQMPAAHFHVSGIPETWESLSEMGQRSVKETIGKMKTER